MQNCLQNKNQVFNVTEPHSLYLSIRIFFRLLRRHFLIILSTLIMSIAASWIYISLSPSEYTALAVVQLDPKRLSAPIGSPTNEQSVDAAVIESQFEILKSDKIVYSIIDKLSQAQKLNLTQSAGSNGWLAITRFFAPDTVLHEKNKSRFTAINVLKKCLKMQRLGRSYIAQIQAVAFDPQTAADIANGAADAYIQDQLDSKLESSKRVTLWMSDRLDEVRVEADRAQETAREFRRMHSSQLMDQTVRLQAEKYDVSASAARESYQSLMGRLSWLTQFLQQQALPTTEARVIDVAVPPIRQSAPNIVLITIISASIGILTGVGLALFRGLFDNRVRDSFDIERAGQLYLGNRKSLNFRFPVVAPELNCESADFEVIGNVVPTGPLVLTEIRKSNILKLIKIQLDRRKRTSKPFVLSVVSKDLLKSSNLLAYLCALYFRMCGHRVLLLSAGLFAAGIDSISIERRYHRFHSLIQKISSMRLDQADADAGVDVVRAGEGSLPAVFGLSKKSGIYYDFISSISSRYEYVILAFNLSNDDFQSSEIEQLSDFTVMFVDARKQTKDNLIEAGEVFAQAGTKIGFIIG